MYEFIKTNEEARNTSSHAETVFNGNIIDRELTDFDGGFRTLLVEGRAISNYSVGTLETSSGHGGILGSRFLTPRLITITYKLWDSTNEGFRKRYERLNVLLSESEKKLRFTDDPNYYFIATFTDGDSPEENTNEVISSISFICHDPFKYTDPVSQRGAAEVRLITLFPASPVIDILLESDVSEFILTNTSTDKVIHMKSNIPFSSANSIKVNTRNWKITQDGVDRLSDLVITSDLEDFTVKRGDILTLSVPGTFNIELEGVAL